ncbi:MAG: diguanylate cyclase domain protein [Sporomusa sp.]|nr:diguanylate cyclase domain protein [Sporomusa sp.]
MKITTKLQMLMTVAAAVPVIVIIFMEQAVAAGAGVAALVGLLGPFLAARWLVTKDLGDIRALCKLVKEGKYRIHTALPNEATDNGEENEFVSVMRDMNWMAREIKLREGQLNAAINDLDMARKELLDQKAALEVANKRLNEMAMTDPLTGLSNRRHFFDHLEQEICRANRSQMPISLFILDIDYFKQVNDRYGHQAGDVVLKAIAHILRGRLRRSDMASRIGGEEFAVLLSDTDLAETMKVAEQIRNSIKEFLFQTCDGESVKVTCSIGVFSGDNPDFTKAELLYKYADKALYHAKNSGRDRVVYCDSAELMQEAADRLGLQGRKGVH